jgi:hypothetical protein
MRSGLTDQQTFIYERDHGSRGVNEESGERFQTSAGIREDPRRRPGVWGRNGKRPVPNVTYMDETTIELDFGISAAISRVARQSLMPSPPTAPGRLLP